MLGNLDVFHVGLSVPDLQQAMRTIGSNLGISWAPTQERVQKVRTGAGETREEHILFTYSADGPPHVELIQPEPGSVWGITPANGLHHIGAFAVDVAVLPGDGLALEFGGGHGERPVGFAYYTSPAGIRIELVDQSRRRQFADWFAGGAKLEMAR
ncbi:MAG TPA: VOC family protein [Solirubrobacteraceae bacterium]|nr:VOC family protein [Solirubrobacteraceae bacterium]